MLTDAYLHAAVICLVVAGFLVGLVAGFAIAGVGLAALAYIHARAEAAAPGDADQSHQ